nr:hypothetical protein [Abalone asfa-like virus]
MVISVFIITRIICWYTIYLQPNTVLKFTDDFMIANWRETVFAPFYYVISDQKLYIIPASYKNISIVWIANHTYTKVLYYDKTEVRVASQKSEFAQDVRALVPISPPQEINDYLNEIPLAHEFPTRIRNAFLIKYYQRSPPLPLVLFPENYQEEEIVTPRPISPIYFVTFADLSSTKDIPIYKILIPFKMHWFVVYLNSNLTLSLRTNFMIIDVSDGKTSIPLIFYYIVSNNKLYILLELTNHAEPYFDLFLPQTIDKILIYDKSTLRVTKNIINKTSSFLERYFHTPNPDYLLPITPPQKNISTLISNLPSSIMLPEHVKEQLITKYSKPNPPLIIYQPINVTQEIDEFYSPILPPLTNG